jgi:hypothetical protein
MVQSTTPITTRVLQLEVQIKLVSYYARDETAGSMTAMQGALE